MDWYRHFNKQWRGYANLLTQTSPFSEVMRQVTVLHM
jgi:hypothetical protein